MNFAKLFRRVSPILFAGIIVGGSTVPAWKQFELFGLYEIVPGFVFALIAI